MLETFVQGERVSAEVHDENGLYRTSDLHLLVKGLY